ncbi:MAG: hypothetical protein ACE5E7_06340 [Anaerolineae bacterium]
MPDWSALLIIAAANTLLGWLIVRCLAGETFEALALERLFASLTIGIAITGWMALVLAELGVFSIGRLSLGWLLLTGGLAWKQKGTLSVRWEKPSLSMTPTLAWPLRLLEPLFLAIWFIVALWLFFRPHEFIKGGADAGVYVNLGAEIAQHGRILIQDDLLADMDPALYPALLRAQPNPIAPYYLLPAFLVVGEPAGQIVPWFYPLHPVWEAIAYGVGGVQAELLLIGMWALLGGVAFYLTVRQFAGWATGALALAGLSINALQVWFARYPTTEAFAQYLLWAGLWSVSVWLSGRRPGRLWALVAGLALGSLFLLRIDAVFILPVLFLLGLWMWTDRRGQDGAWWFWLPVVALGAHSIIHGLWQSQPYFYELFGIGLKLALGSWWLTAVSLGVGVALLWGVYRFRGRWTDLSRFQRPALGVAVLVLLLMGLYAWFIRPLASDLPVWNDPYGARPIQLYDHENLRRLGWYLSPVGVWLGILGIGWLIWRINRRTAVMIGICLIFSILYIWRIRANPHQIYAMRRYVPAVMPLFIVGAAASIGSLAAGRKRWQLGLAGLLAAVWLGGLGWEARGFVSQVDYRGMVAQVEGLNTLLEQESVLIFQDPAPVGMGDFWGTPLKFLYGHDVFTLRDPSQVKAMLLVQTIKSWQNKGHTVYWVGDTSWMVANQVPFHELGEYTLAGRNMEASYVHKPQAVQPREWILQLSEIEAQSASGSE